MDEVALADGIGSTVVGALGVIGGYLSARGQRDSAETIASSQREHERALARETRLHDELRTAYTELLQFVHTFEPPAKGEHERPSSGPRQSSPGRTRCGAAC